MIVSAGSDGDLLVRVGAERHDEFLHDTGPPRHRWVRGAAWGRRGSG